MSHLFAYLSRMKFIRRWGLMHNTYPENIQEHSLRVAMIAHALAVIRNRQFGGHLLPERAAVLAPDEMSRRGTGWNAPTLTSHFRGDRGRGVRHRQASLVARLGRTAMAVCAPDSGEAETRWPVDIER